MLDGIRVLQMGDEDWSTLYQMPDCIDFFYEKIEENDVKVPYDLVFVDRQLSENEVAVLRKCTKTYTLYITNETACNSTMQEYYDCRRGKRIGRNEIAQFLTEEARNYFAASYGEKFSMKNLGIAQGFHGDISWNGNYSVILTGDFGEAWRQIVFWRNNIPVFRGQAIDLWLEYEKTGTVEIALSVTQFVQGSISEVQQEWQFSEAKLQDIVRIDNDKPDGMIFVSILARGNGTLKVVSLHDRYSRRGHGYFLPGGERYVTSQKEEVFCYFDPGDYKPPLNVFFSGYKTRQGFEGYHFMCRLGCPFLLIAEPRLEGGSFYMGSAEYESLLKKCIAKYMRELNFSREQVIMAGISMGTTGALYYGCDIRPHAILLGKPLTNLGTIAENERLSRPGGFATSLDILQYLSSTEDDSAVDGLNQRFWGKFDRTDWSDTKFVVSYMIEDDYDGTAYEDMIAHLQSEGTQIYGKGIHGRHNDATGAIVSWFSGQYDQLLYEDFGRKVEK